MDTTGSDITIIDVPRDDGTIGRTIEELDAKITSWVDAIADAQWIVEKLAQVELRGAPNLGDSVATPDPAPDPVRPSTAAGAKTPVEAAPRTAAPAGGKKKGLRLDHLTNKPAAPTRKKGITVFEDQEEEAPAAPQDMTQEDEALLATLDPKVARQIRIRRRLGNGKKSVRQLLDEGMF